MKLLRKQEGFTLVELLIAIVTGSIVALAATTVLLLGLRLNNSSSGTATRQNNARILLSVLESMAAEGDIQQVGYQLEDQVYNGWVVRDETDKVLFSYSQSTHTVYAGETPLMEDILFSYVDLEGNLLTVSITTKDETYMSSIYCRRIDAETVEGNIDNEVPEEIVDEIIDEIKPSNPDTDGTGGETGTQNNTTEARIAFLEMLLSQYQLKDGGSNQGVILDDGYSTGKHYTEWFIYGYNDRNPGWNKETPWCACYVSWCIDQIEGTWIAEKGNPAYYNEYYHWYDNVDEFMLKYFLDCEQKGYGAAWENSAANTVNVGEEKYTPISGDLIFFDWTMNNDKWKNWKNSGDQDIYAPNPSHVGVVISVQGDYVYTIEGNTGGRVAIRKYKIDDPNIIGYGIMPWKTDNPQ